MLYSDLADLTKEYLGGKVTLNSLMEDSGGELGDSDSAKTVRLFVVGTAKQQGLERMVDFLAQYQMPITVVSYEVFDVSKGQRILVRELTETEVEPPQSDKRRQYLEDVIQLAETAGIGKSFRDLREAAEQHNLYPRVWPKSIMYTPPSNHARMLFTVRARTKQKGKIRVFVGTDVFPEFYPVSLKDARACLGPSGWHYMSPEQVKKFITGLDKLFAGMPDEE